MGHPGLENGTPFAFSPLFLADEEGRPLLVPCIKATYDITDESLVLAEEQLPVAAEGEPYGEPGKSTYRYEPESSLPKQATDVALVGSAFAPRSSPTEAVVGFQVGQLKKVARVVGDRLFFRSMGSVGMTEPRRFDSIPLQWERAFGGWDRSDPDEKKHDYERRNPFGVGFAGKRRFEEGLRCPNLEDPARPFKGWGDRPQPVGFGFTLPDWEPRVRFAGTYDGQWAEERAPLLPADFDRRFLNSAAPGLVAPGYLRGDEPVGITGASRAGGIGFRLPAMAPPTVTVVHWGREDAKVAVNLDTVVVDTDRRKVLLVWKGELRIREPTAVKTVRIVPVAGTQKKEGRWERASA